MVLQQPPLNPVCYPEGAPDSFSKIHWPLNPSHIANLWFSPYSVVYYRSSLLCFKLFKLYFWNYLKNSNNKDVLLSFIFGNWQSWFPRLISLQVCSLTPKEVDLRTWKSGLQFIASLQNLYSLHPLRTPCCCFNNGIY